MHLLTSLFKYLALVRAIAICSTQILPSIEANISDSLSSSAGSRPNIVFILADDLGYGDLGAYGGTTIFTPNIDRLADEGVLLQRFYANSSVCTPTRAALMTGRYPQRSPGMEAPIGVGNVGRYAEAKALAAKGELGLSPEDSVLPSLLKKQGYRSAIIGKWHLGYEKHFRPLSHGFDFFIGPLGYGGDYFHHIEQVESLGLADFEGNNAMARNDQQHFREGYYMTHLFTDEAIAWMNQQRDGRPFFLYLPYTTPHFPMQAPEDFRPKPLEFSEFSGHCDATYIRMVEDLDEQVGRLLAQLDRQGIADNTIVVFMSDNGPQEPEGTRSSGPFRGKKGDLFEGGIRVPLIIRWPGKIEPGTISTQTGIGMDLTYSFLKAAGVEDLNDHHLDGIDIVQHVIQSKPDFDRTLFFRYLRGERNRTAVMNGHWKYGFDIHEEEFIHHYLFNLDTDPGETNNLISKNLHELKLLQSMLRDWQNEVDKTRKERTHLKE